MPDPQFTREWTPQVKEGGPDEQARVKANIVPDNLRPTRTYAPSPEGGPDELARGGAQFAAEALERQRLRKAREAATVPSEESAADVEAEIRKSLGETVPTTTPEPEPPSMLAALEDTPKVEE